MSIDNKIVQMDFQNKKFNKGVKDTEKTWGEFKKALGDEASIKTAVSNMSAGIQSISSKINFLTSTMGIAVMKVKSAIVDTTKKVVDMLTVAPISQGFEEYELKINSIQTMLLGTGESLEYVNQKLDELNHYADRTIYSFSDMTSNIGKFTNAGVGLDDSVNAIQGISNLAAVSGANANEASRAMYNFAQALATGHVKLIDWKSIENANMATVEFKQTLIDTALAEGRLKKQKDGTYRVLKKNGRATKELVSATGNFNDTLQHGWLTNEVLIKTLSMYSDENTDLGKKAFAAATEVKTFTQLVDTLQEGVGSGWAETWEHIFGDFNQAKELWTNISKSLDGILDPIAERRNELLHFWNKGFANDEGEYTDTVTGRTLVIDGLTRVLKTLGTVITPIKEAFKTIFPPITKWGILQASVNFSEFTKTLKFSEKTILDVGRTFKGLFAALDIAKRAFGVVTGTIKNFLKILKPAGSGILDMTGNIGDWIVKLRDGIIANKTFEKATNKINEVMINAAEIIKTKWAELTEWFRTKDWSSILEPLHAAWGKVTEIFNNIFKGDKEITSDSKIQNIFNGIVNAFNWVKEKLQPIFTFLGNIWNKIKENFSIKGAGDIINSGLLTWLLLTIRNFIKDSSGFVKGVTGILDGVADSLKAFAGAIRAKALKQIAMALLMLAGALLIISTIEASKLTEGLLVITTLLVELTASLILMTTFAKGSEIGKASKALIMMGGAILIISFAMKNLSGLSYDELTKGIVSVGTLVLMLTMVAKSMTTDTNARIMKGMFGLVAFAKAIDILGKAVGRLGKTPMGVLIKGLISIKILISAVNGMLKANEKGMMNFSAGMGLLAVSAAIHVLITAIKRLAKIKMYDLIKGMAALGLVLLELGLFTKVAGGAANMFSTGMGILAIAAAMLVFRRAIVKMAEIPMFDLIKGIGAIGASLWILSKTVKASLPKTLAKDAFSLIVFSGALYLMGAAISSISKMDVDVLRLVPMVGSIVAVLWVLNKSTLTVKKSLTTIGIFALALGAVAGLFALIEPLNSDGMITKATAMGLAVVAIAAAIKLIGGVPPSAGALAAANIGIFTVAMGGILTIFGLLAPALPLINKGGEVLIAITNVLGQAVGALIGGVFEGITGSLPGIGTSLSNFITNLEPFLTGIKGVDGSILSGIGTLSAAILMITGTSVLQGLSRWLTFGQDPIDMFVANAKKLGLGVSEFATTVEGIDGTSLQAIANVGLTLAQMERTLPRHGGVVTTWFGGDSDLTQFGEGLVAFGTSLKDFGDSVAGINTTDIENAATAGGSLATLETNLPKHGGKLHIWTGDATLSTFGAGLSTFGTALVDFGVSVTGLNVKAIEKAATAGTALSELESGLPPHDGLLQLWTGQAKLSDFGAGFVGFGTGLKGLSDSVKGISLTNIENAVTAGTSLSELEAGLPPHGGLVKSWILGDNDLGKFGENLALFGTAMSGFGEATNGVSEGDADKAKTISEVLLELEQNLPDAQSGLSKLFTGDDSLAGFGKNLAGFGAGLGEFNTSISGISQEHWASVVSAISDYVALGEGVEDATYNGVSELARDVAWSSGDLKKASANFAAIDAAKTLLAATAINALANMMANIQAVESVDTAVFVKNLTDAGDFGVSAFISAFTDKLPTAKDTGDALAAATQEGLQIKKDEYAPIGKAGAIAFGEAIVAENAAMKLIGETTVGEVLSGLSSKSESITSAGKTVTENFLSGITGDGEGSELSTTSAGSQIADEVNSGINSKWQNFFSSGLNLATSFLTAIRSQLKTAYNTGASFGGRALAGLNQSLAIKSPSGEGYDSGGYFGEGIILGILSKINEVKTTTGTLGDTMLSALRNAMSESSEVFEEANSFSPVITPVVDLNDVRAGTKGIASLFNSVGRVRGLEIAGALLGENAVVGSGSVLNTKQDVKVEFNQVNNSPKALGRMEIYRQTKNQVAQIRNLDL